MCGNLHQTTIGKNVHRVSRAISELKDEYIVFPRTAEEQEKVVRDFYKIARMPNVLGTIDCTHIKINNQGGDYGELHRNRKGYFSLNVQTISDSKLLIRDLVSRWYGSSHDSTIFYHSQKRAMFESGVFHPYVLLGDSGYGVKNYLFPPVPNPTTAAERAYNYSQIATRNTVERQYGVWKRRFPVLALGIRSPYLENIQAIITATAILHNISIQQNNPEAPEDHEVNLRVQQAMQQFPPPDPFQPGLAGREYDESAREAVIRNHFSV
jgi:hypothetical protein